MRKSFNLFAAIAGLAIAGCDSDLAVQETSSALSVLQRSTPEPVDGCNNVIEVNGGQWRMIPVVNNPSTVLVERDGKPVCFDTIVSAKLWATSLGLELQPPSIAPLSTWHQAMSKAPQSTSPADEVSDDPIPIGGNRIQNVQPK